MTKELDVTFENGNKRVTVTVRRGAPWTKGDRSRQYYEVECDQGRSPIHSLYEVISGTYRGDFVVTRKDGRIFVVDYGVDANSGTKRDHIKEAVSSLVELL